MIIWNQCEKDMSKKKRVWKKVREFQQSKQIEEMMMTKVLNEKRRRKKKENVRRTTEWYTGVFDTGEWRNWHELEVLFSLIKPMRSYYMRFGCVARVLPNYIDVFKLPTNRTHATQYPATIIVSFHRLLFVGHSSDGTIWSLLFSVIYCLLWNEKGPMLNRFHLREQCHII